MRKQITAIGAALVLLAVMVAPALGAAPTLVVAMRLNSPWCVVGSELTHVDGASEQVYPISEQNRTLLPVSPVVKAFGGNSTWDPATNKVIFTRGFRQVELELGSTALTVDGESGVLEVPARAINNRTYVPIRAVLEGLGLTVEYEAKNQIIVVADGDLDPAELTVLPQVKMLLELATPKGDPVKLNTQSYALASGTVSANVITVDMTDPRVHVKAALSDGKLNLQKDFKATALASGAVAVINGNFFTMDGAFKDPVGHLMGDGQFLYGSSGVSSLGITNSNEMRYGRPAIFFRVKTVDGGTPQQWAAFEVNVNKQFDNQSVIYTPARGASFPVTFPGAVLTVRGDVTNAYRLVNSGETVDIPADGFVLYSSTQVMSTDYYRAPEIGRKVAIEPYLLQPDAEGFTLDGVQTMVSGSPRLVKDGAIDGTKDAGFDKDNRFKTAVTPRTAVGSTADGKLLLVNVKAATINQMCELMLKLGCVDAINLDGGASTGMYYNGKVLATPGRGLTSTLQVFVSK